MTENPERLWAYAHQGGETIRAEASADLAEQDRGEYGCDPAPVAEYIRADVVAREREAAVRAERERIVNTVIEQVNTAYESGADEPNMGGFVMDALREAAVTP